MNKSEIFLVMVSEWGTHSWFRDGNLHRHAGWNGSCCQGYVCEASHLGIFMAVPGSIVLATCSVHRRKEQLTEPSRQPTWSSGEKQNILDAISGGTMTGVKLMVNIAAMLLVFISLSHWPTTSPTI